MVAAFDRFNGELIWITQLTPGDPVPSGQQISPIVAGGLVIVGTSSAEETNVGQFPNGTYNFFLVKCLLLMKIVELLSGMLGRVQ